MYIITYTIHCIQYVLERILEILSQFKKAAFYNSLPFVETVIYVQKNSIILNRDIFEYYTCFCCHFLSIYCALAK